MNEQTKTETGKIFTEPKGTETPGSTHPSILDNPNRTGAAKTR